MNTLAPNHVQQLTGGFVPPRDDHPNSFGGGNHSSSRLLRRYRLGVGLWVCSIVMLFVGLSSAYVVRRGIPTYDAASATYSTAWEKLHLPMAILVVNTLVLIAASLTIEVARRVSRAAYFASVPKKEWKSVQLWSVSSLLLLTAFIAGQVVAWQQMQAKGEFLASGARAAFFYVLSGTHAVHAVIGLFLLAWIVLSALAHRSAMRRYMATDLTAWYLHSMTILWIYLLTFLLIVR